MASDVTRQLRLEAMFNDRPVDESEPERRRALERLIEQKLLQRDMTLAGYAVAEDSQLQSQLEQLRGQRFAGMTFEEALDSYGLTEEIVLRFVRRQIDFRGYIQFRFATGLEVTDEEVAREYKRLYPEAGAGPAAEQAEALRERLLAEKSARLVDERVKQLRAETRIVVLGRIETEPEEAPEIPEQEGAP